MPPTGNLDWVWYGAGIVLGLIGLALAYWSLLHDRSKGRRRCPKCWHDMSSPGPDPLTCPECGKTAKREKDLSRTCRRKFRGLAAILLVLVSCGIGTRPLWHNGQWVRRIPTTALAHIASLDNWSLVRVSKQRLLRLEVFGFYSRLQLALSAELVRRNSLDDFSDKHWGILVQRIHEEQSHNFPMLFRTRTKWPKDWPIYYSLTSDLRYLPSSTPASFKARLKLDGSKWRSTEDSLDSIRIVHFESKSLPPDLDQVTFELEYSRSGNVVWSGESQPIQLVDSIDDILVPFASKELKEKIQDELVIKLHPTPTYPFNVSLTTLNSMMSDRTDLNVVTWGFRIEVRNKDLIVATGHRLFAYSLHDFSMPIVQLTWDREALQRACKNPDPQWRIVIIGDPKVAIYDLESDRYWSGKIEFPFVSDELYNWCTYQNYDN